MTPKLKAIGTKRLKLKYDNLLSNCAFSFNLRRYSMDAMVYDVLTHQSAYSVVGAAEYFNLDPANVLFHGSMQNPQFRPKFRPTPSKPPKHRGARMNPISHTSHHNATKPPGFCTNTPEAPYISHSRGNAHRCSGNICPPLLGGQPAVRDVRQLHVRPHVRQRARRARQGQHEAGHVPAGHHF